MDAVYRFAEPKDVPTILRLIRALAEYERLADQVTATEEVLREWLFEKQRAEVLLCELEGKAVGYALFFHNFSTFLGRAGLYLEDIFVKEEYRGRGYGRGFMRELGRIALARGCGRMEWSCLDWNKSSIDFYRSLGAEPMEGWTVYRMNENALHAFMD